MNLTYRWKDVMISGMGKENVEFQKAALYVVDSPYYIVDVLLNKIKADMCVTCRKKTNYMVAFILNKELKAPVKYSNCYCCGPKCLEKEIEILNSSIVEWITD